MTPLESYLADLLAVRGAVAIIVVTTLVGGVPRIVQAALAVTLGLWSALLVAPSHPTFVSIAFAVQEIAGPDFYGQTSNNNALSSVITANEDGTGVQRIEKFNFLSRRCLLDIVTKGS